MLRFLKLQNAQAPDSLPVNSVNVPTLEFIPVLRAISSVTALSTADSETTLETMKSVVLRAPLKWTLNRRRRASKRSKLLVEPVPAREPMTRKMRKKRAMKIPNTTKLEFQFLCMYLLSYPPFPEPWSFFSSSSFAAVLHEVLVNGIWPVPMSDPFSHHRRYILGHRLSWPWVISSTYNHFKYKY